MFKFWFLGNSNYYFIRIYLNYLMDYKCDLKIYY